MQYKFIIKVPVYNFSCTVIFADVIEPCINKVLKKEKFPLIEGQVYGYAVGGNDISKYYLFYSLNGLNASFLSHEISHLVDYVFEDREITPLTGETRAYLTGYISNEIFEFVYKNKIPISKWLKY